MSAAVSADPYSIQYWLLVRHHFIFLNIFLESNKQYEMLYMLYCNLVGFLKSILQEKEGVFGVFHWRLKEYVQTV